MMMLEDVRDYIASLDVAEHVYMGKLPDKEDKSVGVYNSKHQNTYHTALGGPSLEGYGEQIRDFARSLEQIPTRHRKATVELFEKLKEVRDAEVNGETIKFFQPLYDIQDVGTDDTGIYEMVIEGAVIYEKKEGKET